MRLLSRLLTPIALIFVGCAKDSYNANVSLVEPAKQPVVKDRDVVNEFVCGTTVLVKRNGGIFLDSGEELKQPGYVAKVVTDKEGGYTTEYDYDAQANVLYVRKSSRYYVDILPSL